jgi:hypothetical protein
MLDETRELRDTELYGGSGGAVTEHSGPHPRSQLLRARPGTSGGLPMLWGLHYAGCESDEWIVLMMQFNAKHGINPCRKWNDDEVFDDCSARADQTFSR